MNKANAIEKMEQGVKMTHTTFTDEEWITMKDGSVQTEEGYSHNRFEFWSYRQMKAFDEGWSEFIPESEKNKVEEMKVVDNSIHQFAVVGSDGRAFCFLSKQHPDVERLTNIIPKTELLIQALKGVLNIVNDSQGVAGYHRNGRVANWDEFDEIIEAEELIKRIEG